MEWGTYAASRTLPSVLSHLVLPDLGADVVSPFQRSLFFDNVPSSSRIQTVAVNNRSREDWLRHARCRTLEGLEHEYLNDDAQHLLIVGGNKKSEARSMLGVSTCEAIRSVLQHGGDGLKVWAVVDPNDRNSALSLANKLEAGATGIITQPLLSSRSFESLHLYSSVLRNYSGISFVAGMAMPKTLRGLIFWESLLNSDLKSDPLFQDHCRHFETSGDDCQWALNQQRVLEEFSIIDGVHYMPLKNSGAMTFLLKALEKEQSKSFGEW